MTKSREIFDKLGRLLEKGILNTKDISNEFINICKSKRDEFIFHTVSYTHLRAHET